MTVRRSRLLSQVRIQLNLSCLCRCLLAIHPNASFGLISTFIISFTYCTYLPSNTSEQVESAGQIRMLG